MTTPNDKRHMPSIQTQYAYAVMERLLQYGNNAIVHKIRQELSSCTSNEPFGRFVLRKLAHGNICVLFLGNTSFDREELLGAIMQGDQSACMVKAALEGLFRDEPGFVLAFAARLSRTLGYHVTVTHSIDADEDVILDVDGRMCGMQ